MRISTCFLSGALCLLLPVWSHAQASRTVNTLAVVKLVSKAVAESVIAIPSATSETSKHTFTGTVLDEWEEPLAGVMITVVSEPDLSGITNSMGGYMLRSASATPVLRVSYAGYRDVQVVGNAAGPLMVQLEPIYNYERQLKKTLKSAEKAYRKP